jgi:hypothetical protein
MISSRMAVSLTAAVPSAACARMRYASSVSPSSEPDARRAATMPAIAASMRRTPAMYFPYPGSICRHTAGE